MLGERMREIGLHVAQLTSTFIENLYQTACLHDIGKVGTPDAILLKPGKLAPEEFTEMRKHCELGAATLAKVLERHPDNEFLRMASIRPGRTTSGGTAPAIPMVCRARPSRSRTHRGLADFYDALTSNRCYRPAFSHENTCRMIQAGSGTHFDPDVTTAFTDVAGEFKRVRLEMCVENAATDHGSHHTMARV